MSIDEGSEIHEMATEPMKNFLNIEQGIFYFSWVIPFGLLTIVITVYFYKFWLKLTPLIKKLFLWSTLIYLSGALGFEMIGGYYISSGGSEFIYSFIVGIEETLELVGLSIMVYSLLKHYSENFPKSSSQVA
jgi:hypothetical protein